MMFSIFNKTNKKKSIQSKSDNSNSETVDYPGPSTPRGLGEREHQSISNVDTENVFTTQILNLGLGDIESGPYRPILAVSTY